MSLIGKILFDLHDFIFEPLDDVYGPYTYEEYCHDKELEREERKQAREKRKRKKELIRKESVEQIQTEQVQPKEQININKPTVEAEEIHEVGTHYVLKPLPVSVNNREDFVLSELILRADMVETDVLKDLSLDELNKLRDYLIILINLEKEKTKKLK